EHTSVHAAMNTLEREGYEITKLSLTSEGVINLEELHRAIREDTVFISIQHVNSEIGWIQPVEEISTIAREHGIPYHVDCVQSFCKL
ncbi:aminotransferase class V-fold PLP-dependent enzyme, partial [Brevibacterium sp. SIMBA_078]|uniref:aminotransferase class V-fold PLP-dependent enzyme n=1 Tax=Brevibacterium sp. SIMBA_078 TaxID=3085816 RepID=UPI00397BB1BB